MNPIPLSQFDASKYAGFPLHRLIQCSEIQSLEAEVEALRRGLIEETAQSNKQRKPDAAQEIDFGPVVVGEATAVTDHIDVYQYYQLVQKKG